MKNEFDPKNPRVKLAYQKRSLNIPAVKTFCFVVFVALIIGGGVLLYFKEPIGWTIIGFSATLVNLTV